MSKLGWIHMTAALAAIASGAVVLLTRKGTTRVGSGAAFGLAVIMATFVIVSVGSRMINRHKDALLAPYRALKADDRARS